VEALNTKRKKTRSLPGGEGRRIETNRRQWEAALKDAKTKVSEISLDRCVGFKRKRGVPKLISWDKRYLFDKNPREFWFSDSPIATPNGNLEELTQCALVYIPRIKTSAANFLKPFLVCSERMKPLVIMVRHTIHYCHVNETENPWQ
jgi:hypothetical protein